MARRQSFLSMKTSGKHSDNDLLHAQRHQRSSDVDTMNPKDSYENLLEGADFEILEHTEHEVHENDLVMDSEEIEAAKANHLHVLHVANRKVSVAGTLHSEKLNDKHNDRETNNTTPPPPSFSESEHRMSAMLFHVPPPLEKKDVDEEFDVASLPPPPPLNLPPSGKNLSSLLPPPPPPPTF